MGLFDMTHLNVSELARKEARKTNKLLAEQNALLRRQGQVSPHGLATLEGALLTVSWDGEWLSGRPRPDLARAVAFVLRGAEFRVHRASIAEVSDTPPKLLGDGQLVVVTREGKRHQIDYKKAEQADFAALAAQLLDAISGPAAAAPPLPPAVMAPPPPPLPPAGWFPAPGREGWLRYWDGTAWTEHYHDPSLPPPV